MAVELHRFIIGSKGRDIRQLMDDCEVSIQIPPADENIAALKVTGTPDNVARARRAILQKVQLLEDEKEQRVCYCISCTSSSNSLSGSRIRKNSSINRILITLIFL